MSCCHYDEGYQDGLAEGSGQRFTETFSVAEALRLYAEECERRSNWERADIAREIAAEIQQDTRIGSWLVARLEKQAA